MPQVLKGLEKHLKKVDNSLLAFKGEVDDRFQSLEDKIDRSEGKVLGVLSEVMGELKTIRESQDILTERTYENVTRLDKQEAQIKSLS